MKQHGIYTELYNIYRENKLAHAYLFETNDVEACYKDLVSLVKMMFCDNPAEGPCDSCNTCHLITENNLPSIVCVEPDGKFIKKDAIDALKTAFSHMPIYTPYNIYFIKYPEKMNDTAYNKMLKFLEEPENNIIGFYITMNKDNVANTIVSRCELLKVSYQDLNENNALGVTEEDYNLALNYVEPYIKMLEANDPKLPWYNINVLLKNLTTREQIVCFLKLVYNTYEKAFHKTENIDYISLDNILRKLQIIAKYLEELNYNVNLWLMLDSFVIEMGEVYGN